MAVSVESFVRVHGCKFCEQCYRNANSPVGMALQPISEMGRFFCQTWWCVVLRQNHLISTETLCTNVWHLVPPWRILLLGYALLRGQSYTPYFKSHVYNLLVAGDML